MIKIYTKHKLGEGLIFDNPGDEIEGLDDLLKAAHKKYSGNVLLTIALPHRPRTTGNRSQNHIIRGDSKSISEQFSKIDPKYSPQTVHSMLKIFAVKEGKYPYLTIGSELIPLSEADISVEQAIEFTEYIEKFADENNLWLIRMDEKGIPYKTVGGRTREEMEKYWGNK